MIPGKGPRLTEPTTPGMLCDTSHTGEVPLKKLSAHGYCFEDFMS
jgi:hypothetical protein